jgi:hypothetical protein
VVELVVVEEAPLHALRAGVVGEAVEHHDAVEQARVGVGDHALLHRRAGAAPAHRVEHRAVGLDEALLDHHHGFGRDDVVAVLPEVVERGVRNREALAQRQVVERIEVA